MTNSGGGASAGSALEHYIFTEISAYNSIKEKDFDIRYWRTKSGLEVDFILGHAQCGIEIKISSTVALSDIKGLIAFKEEHPEAQAIVVCMTPRPRRVRIQNGYIDFLPVKDFLTYLWDGKWI